MKGCPDGPTVTVEVAFVELIPVNLAAEELALQFFMHAAVLRMGEGREAERPQLLLGASQHRADSIVNPYYLAA